jgi:hypothetical protein
MQQSFEQRNRILVFNLKFRRVVIIIIMIDVMFDQRAVELVYELFPNLKGSEDTQGNKSDC